MRGDRLRGWCNWQHDQVLVLAVGVRVPAPELARRPPIVPGATRARPGRPVRCRRRCAPRTLVAAAVAGAASSSPRRPRGRRRSRDAARRGARRHAVHRLLRRARDGRRAVRRRGDRRRRRPRDGAGPRILVSASGPAVDETGIGPGLLRLADLLPRRAAARRATSARSPRRSASTAARSCWRRRSRRSSATRSTRRTRRERRRATLARARPLAAPLTVTGLNPRLGSALQRRPPQARAARARGAGRPARLVPRPAAAARARRSASATRRATSRPARSARSRTRTATACGASATRSTASARARCCSQDAYVFRVINNPLAIADIAGTYKYAAAGHDVGTLTNDALDGRRRARRRPARDGARCASSRPTSTPARSARVGDERRRRGARRPADRQLDPVASSRRSPSTQAAGTVLGGSPAAAHRPRLLRDRAARAREPVRFCNRYVTDTPDPLGAGNVRRRRGEHRPAGRAVADRRLQGRRRARHRRRRDVRDLARPAPGVPAQRQAAAPRARRPAGRARRSRCATCAAGSSGARVRLRLPRDLRPGKRRSCSRGADVDDARLGDLPICSSSTFDIGGAAAASSGRANQARPGRGGSTALARYDGVSARRRARPDDFDPGERRTATRTLRISGRARATIRIRSGERARRRLGSAAAGRRAARRRRPA